MAVQIATTESAASMVSVVDGEASRLRDVLAPPHD